MQKKDFFMLMGCNLVTVVLLIEHLCGMDLALEFMIGWQMLNMIIHFFVLRDYARPIITVEEIDEDDQDCKYQYSNRTAPKF